MTRPPLLLLAAACLVRGSGRPGDPLYDTAPSITAIDWSCSMDAETWMIEIGTDAWTDGGTLWMARDLARVESFRLRSVGAAPDGGPDTLRTTLSVVADPADAEDGSTTSFPCTAKVRADIAFRVVIRQPGSGDAGDCRDFGPVLDLFDGSDEVEPCDLDWDEPDTGP